ncbi:MAG: glycosyltransferase 87 family protein [Acidobacteriota bacterium]
MLTRALLLGLLLFFTAIIVVKGIVPAMADTRGDFANYYTAARILADGRSVEPAYRDFIWFQKQMDRYGIKGQVGGFIPHPPSTALLLLPLSRLDALTAKRVWIGFNAALAVLCVVLLAKTSHLNWLLTGILFLGSGAALINNFLFGQVYLLLLASLLLGLYFRQRGRPVAAGVCLALLIPVKYVGTLWVAYSLWRKEARIVTAAALTLLVVLMATLWLGGFQSFQTFADQVLPRHLKGEIQDPFATRAQSWNSLFRRLFLFQETLNPHPAAAQPFFFFLLKNLILWGLGAFSLFILLRASFALPGQNQSFQLGWIPLSLLLLSPTGATYHFLLLTMTAVPSVKLLLDLGKPAAAGFLGVQFVVLNLPHYLRLEDFARGWWTPLAYSRLYLLLIFYLSIVFFLRRFIRWSPGPGRWAWGAVILLIGLSTIHQYGGDRNQPLDGARLLKIAGKAFDRHLGLILGAPDGGKDELLFSYCELFREDYAIYAADGERWTPPASRNYYDMDLASDDASLLVETVEAGRSEIWLSRKRGEPAAFVAEGEKPSWGPDGLRFASVKEGDLRVTDIASGKAVTVLRGGRFYDVAYSPRGTHLAYCVRNGEGSSLGIFDLRRRQQSTLLHSEDRITSPAWSSNQRTILFAWDRPGNRDIWAVEVESRQTSRLTVHLGADDEPVWDGAHNRIVFTSDRGRGLEFSTLYWIPIPDELQ